MRGVRHLSIMSACLSYERLTPPEVTRLRRGCAETYCLGDAGCGNESYVLPCDVSEVTLILPVNFIIMSAAA